MILNAVWWSVVWMGVAVGIYLLVIEREMLEGALECVRHRMTLLSERRYGVLRVIFRYLLAAVFMSIANALVAILFSEGGTYASIITFTTNVGAMLVFCAEIEKTTSAILCKK